MIKRTLSNGPDRTKLKRYALLLGSMATLVAKAGADTVGLFTFETTGIASTGPSVGPIAADSGVGSAYGFHTATTAVYSSPAGNGSAKSFSANTWTIGDYYQFNINSTNYTNLAVAFDMARSGTGPGNFTLQYSTDSGFSSAGTITTFNIFATVTSTGTAGSATTTFATSASNPAFNISADLSTITGLNGVIDYFRIVDNVSAAAAGTARIDNFSLTGTLAGGGVPEPSTLALLSVAGAGLAAAARRRRKQA